MIHYYSFLLVFIRVLTEKVREPRISLHLHADASSLLRLVRWAHLGTPIAGAEGEKKNAGERYEDHGGCNAVGRDDVSLHIRANLRD